MKQRTNLFLVVLLLGLVGVACAAYDSNTLMQTVNTANAAMEQALQNKRSSSVMEPYLASVNAGAAPAGMQAIRDWYTSVFDWQQSAGKSVQFTHFQIQDVNLDSSRGQAVVEYEADVRFVDGTEMATGRIHQHYALVKTAEGWRISGVDSPQYTNVVGTIPSL